MNQILIVALFSLIAISNVNAGFPQVGAAPKGDAKIVASRVIKNNFPQCKNITLASRMHDGSIRATCDRIDYLVFTVFDANEGKAIEVAINCFAAKQLLDISC